jgi:SAM-dependent methyltransferase
MSRTTIPALEDVSCESCDSVDAQVLYTAIDRFSHPEAGFPLVKCRNCGLVYVNPRPRIEEIAAFYPDAYYDTEVFRESLPDSVAHSSEVRRLADIGRFANKGRILDVGCGAGQFLAAAREAGWQASGLEISPLAAGHCRDHYGLDVVETDLLSAHFPDEQFDVVTMWGVLEHLHHPKQALNEAFRILKPGGLLVTLTPNIGCTQARVFREKWHLLDAPRHLYHFSETTLRQMALQASLTEVWAKFYMPEHDRSNLIWSLQSVLVPQRMQPDSPPVGREPWTARRVAMGVLRRGVPVLARVMAGRRGSAAMELYLRKAGPK